MLPRGLRPCGKISATFLYDGDGQRVAKTINDVTTYFISTYYEVTDGVVTRYYYAGGQRIALRQNGTLLPAQRPPEQHHPGHRCIRQHRL
jgi:hypothetical protein